MGADPSTVASVNVIAELAGQYAAESERERRLADPVVAALRESDLMRSCVPRSVGGGELPVAELARAVETLACADGAAGWCLAIGATSGLIGGYLETDVAAEAYGRAGSIAGGVFAPMGRATPAADGASFVVDGRWPFASGCKHCDWLMGGCVVVEGGEGGAPRMLPNGMPDNRLMLAPASDVEIEDTWHVAGLRGTGSHHIAMRGLTVPAARSASVFSDEPVAAGPLYAFPLFGLLATCIGAVGLGIGRGALKDLVELAGSKRPAAGRRTLAQRGTVQADVARASARLDSARALLYEAVEAAWDAACADGEIPVGTRAALRRAATFAAETGSEVAGAAFALAGATAIYDSSPLQRRLRDASVATQHMLVAPSTWELTGKVLLGAEVDATQL